MSEKQFAYAVQEFVRMSCECEKCQTLIVYDVRKTSVGVPDHCPACQTSLRGFVDAVTHYRLFYNAAEKSKIQLRTAPVTE